MFDFKIYQTGGDEDRGVEYRLSFRLLWFSLNMLLWTNWNANVNEWDGDAPNRPKKWGWYFMDRRDINICFGHWHKWWQLPFITSIFAFHEILDMDGSVVAVGKPGRHVDFDIREKITKAVSRAYSYCYHLKSGRQQHVRATIYRERSTWRRKWTPFLKSEETINISFDQEVGERAGEWKGGCIGCSWAMKKGETPHMALLRMEEQRKFE